jgi:hypothetical protein
MSVLKDITVFKSHDASKSSTLTERKLMFDQMKIGSDISDYHFDAFYENEEQAIHDKFKLSTIPALVIKQLISFITPIVSSSSEEKIKIQFDVPLLALPHDMSDSLMIPRNTQVPLVGLVFTTNKTDIQSDTSQPLVSDRMSVIDRIMNGMNGLHLTYNHPNQKRIFFQSKLSTSLSNKNVIIYFRDGEDTINKLDLLRSYVEYYNNFYNDSLLSSLIITQCPPYDILYDSGTMIRDSTKSYAGKIKPTPLTEFVGSVYTGKLLYGNKLCMLYDIIYGLIWDTYQHAKVCGIDHDSSLMYANLAKKRQKYYKNEAIQFEKHVKTQCYWARVLSMARVLFFKHSTENLSQKELDIIDLAIKKEADLAKALKNNKCDHLKLARIIASSYSNNKYFSKSVWNALKRMMRPTGEASMIQCSICKFNVLCSHYYDIFEYVISSDRFDNQENMRTMLIAKYSDKVRTRDAYYCKVCGERFIQNITTADISIITGEQVRYSNDHDTLKTAVWKGVKSVMSTNVMFSSIVNIDEVSSNITEELYPHICLVKSQADSIKTYSKENVNDIVYLYIDIYVYAELIRIISKAPNDVAFKKNKNKAKGSKLIQQLFATAEKIIIDTKGPLISKIKKTSTQHIRHMLIQAYKKLDPYYITGTNLPPEYIVGTIPYIYMYYAKSKHSKDLQISDIKSILGVDLGELKTLKNIYQNAEIPKQWEYIDNKSNFGASEQYTKYAYASFLHFVKYVVDVWNTPNVLNNSSHEEHYDKYLSLVAFEKKYMTRLRLMMSPVLCRYYDTYYGTYNFKKTSMTKVFCKTGSKHKFDIYIYKNTGTFEIQRKHIYNWVSDQRKNASLIESKLVDVKCSLCSKSLSELQNQFDKEILHNINENDSMASFYNLYTFKCPSGGTHLFVGDTCSKCRLTQDQLNSKDKEYYEKYRGVFLDEITKTNKYIPEPNDTKVLVSKDYPDWVLAYDRIDSVHNITKTNINVLLNIGLSEGILYSDLQNNTANPSKSNANDPNRVLHLSRYIGMFMIEYEMLRNGKITNSMLETFASTWTHIDFKTFPEVGQEYHERFTYYSYKPLSNELLSNFVLESLMSYIEVILGAFKYSTPEHKAAASFTKYILDKIIRIDMSISDPGILRGKILVPINLESVDTADEYDDEEILKEYDPFSTSDLDVERENIVENAANFD